MKLGNRTAAWKCRWISKKQNDFRLPKLAGVTGLEAAPFCDFIEEFERFSGHIHK